EFRAFVDLEIAPYADAFDREQRLPAALIGKLAEARYLAATIPADFGGLGMEPIEYGLLNEEIARGCSSVRSLITVNCMVAQAIVKWGNREQRAHWLPRMAAGKVVAAFG